MADAAAAALRSSRARSSTLRFFNPVIRAKLLTGRDPVYMSAHPVGAETFESEVCVDWAKRLPRRSEG
jgi:hypothetical protein